MGWVGELSDKNGKHGTKGLKRVDWQVKRNASFYVKGSKVRGSVIE